MELLARLAAGDLSARAIRTRTHDDVDAVLVGINMLAEELQASRSELDASRSGLEERVVVRTRELERLNHDILSLSELGRRLQACETVAEAYAVSSEGMRVMFGEITGAMYSYDASLGALCSVASWGVPGLTSDVMRPTECWALRGGDEHFVEAADTSMSCDHVARQSGDSVCVPLTAHGETLGLLHLMGLRSGSSGAGTLT